MAEYERLRRSPAHTTIFGTRMESRFHAGFVISLDLTRWVIRAQFRCTWIGRFCCDPTPLQSSTWAGAQSRGVERRGLRSEEAARQRLASKLNFLVRARREAVPASAFPVFALTTDNWDDYGPQVQFHLSYVDVKGSETRLGAVKILQRTSESDGSIEVAKTTRLPKAFAAVDDSFVSLGQDDEYYKGLHTILGSKSGDVLDALRDIAWRPALADLLWWPRGTSRRTRCRSNNSFCRYVNA